MRLWWRKIKTLKVNSMHTVKIIFFAMFLTGCVRINTPVLPVSSAIEHHLVLISSVSPSIHADLRYATTHNFIHRNVYGIADAYLHEDAARALAAVQTELHAQGLGLLIYDAYRPFHVQEILWNALPDERYVSNPAKNRGRHTRGTTVDVTLIGVDGTPLPMPTEFDDFTPKAFRDDMSCLPEQCTHRAQLEAVMIKHGFVPYPFEWWHFDLNHWEKYPVLDIGFSELARGVATAVPVAENSKK